MTKLNWKLLTKKRAGVTQGLPPGKEDLEMDYRIVHREKGIRDIHAVGRAVLHGSSNLTEFVATVIRFGLGAVRFLLACDNALHYLRE